MRIQPAGYLDARLFSRKKRFPLMGQVELTYGCQFDCVHCYCKGLEDKKKELTTQQWKDILDEVQRAGCLWLGFTGGDPLHRPDFLEIYSFAKQKGFLVTILTNGFGLTKRLLDHFVSSPPYSFEITVNGITRDTFEAVTRAKGSFARVMKNIKTLKKMGFLCYIKSNCLTINAHEIVRIKQWADKLFGRVRKQRYFFSYDFDIFPRLDGGQSPCRYRLSPEKVVTVIRKDQDLRREYRDYLACEFPALPRAKKFLYHCSSWGNQFYINPFGQLRFCQFADKFSTDLKKGSFRTGFYRRFPRLLRQKFKTNSRCKTCRGRLICRWCPAKAFLETGNEEAPVPYYCAQTEYTLCHDRSRKP